MKLETKADKKWAVYLLWVEPTSCLILLKKRGTAAYHPLKRDKSSWSTIFKLLQHLQLISALHSTGNHEFWYCSRSRLLHNSSKTIGSSQDALEMGKCDKKATTHAHSSPKRTQGVAPQPRPVRMLLSLCCSDLRSVVWWKGMSPKILATIELLSLGLLGGTMIGLWKPKSLETCIDLTCHRKPTN
jgi:hypothetical protein